MSCVMLMIIFMSIFSIDMFYYNATGALLFALANIFFNLSKQETESDEKNDIIK